MGRLCAGRGKTDAAGEAHLAFLRADVSAGLPFGDGVFDAVFSLNLLECLPDKQALLCEMHRVLRPDGQVVCAHFDWDSQAIDGNDKNAIRKAIHAYSDWTQNWMTASDGWMGRRLWSTFRRSGLFEGTVHSYVLTNTEFRAGCYGFDLVQAFQALVRRGMLEQAEWQSIFDACAERNKRGEYFYGITLYTYVGRKV